MYLVLRLWRRSDENCSAEEDGVDMSKNIILFIISIPIVVIACIGFAVFYVFGFIAVVIGRGRALNIMYWLKEQL